MGSIVDKYRGSINNPDIIKCLEEIEAAVTGAGNVQTFEQSLTQGDVMKLKENETVIDKLNAMKITRIGNKLYKYPLTEL